MKILIACDSFKDALGAVSVCRAIETGIKQATPSVLTHIFPLADGGEGVSDVLNFHLGLKPVVVNVHDPLFRKIKATYNLSQDGTTAFIEMAQAAGLQYLTMAERNPLKTSTYGVGEMIQDALKKGAKRIVLGIGGSATNDTGIGMAAALGWVFCDENGVELKPIGENLIKIKTIIPPQYANINESFLNIEDVQFDVMCDVTNPLLGKSGAAHVYARQKGATADMIDQLENGARNVCAVLKNHNIHPDAAGAGAAGGLGFGCLYFLKAIIKKGIDVMMDLTHFDAQVAWADVIITGEGKLDSQTAHGKLIAGVIERAQGKPVIALCGALETTPSYLQNLNLKAAFPINQKPCTLEEALASTAINLENTAFNVMRLIGCVKNSLNS
jgi:glycerate 2-kinase